MTDNSALIPPSPTPAHPYEAARWRESARRRRMIDGHWKEDLLDRLRMHLSSVRQEAWGPPSLAINPFRNIVRELAVLYDEAPHVYHPMLAAQDAQVLEQAYAAERLSGQPPQDPIGRRIWHRERAIVRARLVAEGRLPQENYQRLLRQSGVWALMQRVQAWTIGCREYLVRVDVDERGRPRFRSVPPDRVVATPDPERPDQAIALTELRLRPHPETNKPVWTADAFDISDPENPTYTIRSVESGLKLGAADWTEHYLGSPKSGDRYPFRIGSQDRPVIPYPVYHASRTGDRLWDPMEGAELVESSLDLAVCHCFLVHVFRNASWPQRYGIGVEVDGGEMTGGDGARHEVDTDPASFLHFRKADSYDGQPLVSQFSPGGDPKELEETLSNMVARVAQDAGVPPSDVQRLGGTARSGVAISLTNEGKRAAQRRFAATFRDGDERLVALAAAFRNRVIGGDLPEGGYTVAHARIPLSPDELKSRRDHVRELVADGLMTRVQAMLEINPGMSIEEARQELATIDAERTLAR